MLNLLFKDLIKAPGKLLAVCVILYLATMSFLIAFFLVALAARWVQTEMKKKAKAAEAAAAEAARAEAAKPAAVAPNVVPVAAVPAAAPAAPMPQRQYAKSAVVIPFKTGTRN
ncbi:MAG: hypothetical protein KGQ57_00155 [Burkholderiales bacterium]|nr:hypothetical protein [Burkholderiales bacterium]